MTGKPFTGFVVMWDEVPRLMLADYSGDPRARALIQVISNWLDMASARAPLCMSCDAAFHGAVRPAAFAVLLPFVPTAGKAVATGICPECAEYNGDLMELASQHWRHLWPDMSKLPEGHG